MSSTFFPDNGSPSNGKEKKFRVKKKDFLGLNL
jgi:hypothetical protein